MAATKALVIGIDDYGGPPNDLTCCVKDAHAFAHMLQTTYGFDEVHLLRDGDATLENMDDELRWLFQGRRQDDRVVIYFSGLGYTRTKNGIVEECLVLQNGLYTGERLASSASELPPALCTMILDTSFSGVSEHFVADNSRGTPQVEIARAKVWQPTPDEAPFTESEQRVTEFRSFASRPISSPAGIANALAVRAQAHVNVGAPRSSARFAGVQGVAVGEGQLALSGLLLCASLDGESAAAATTRTDGNSAFTHALLHAIRQLGPQISAADIVTAASARLRVLGFQQTPWILDQADLKLRRFLTLEPISAVESLRMMSEPRYWEGVLTAAAPQLSSAWAVTKEVNQMTMQQPLMGAYQPTGAYQQPFGATPFVSDEVNRAVSTIGPALATVLPTIVPQIVNNVLAQQRGLASAGYGQSLTPPFVGATPFAQTGGGLTPFGAQLSHAPVTQEDVQRILPMLTPILANVLPQIVPQIVSSILVQQRASSAPWGSPYGALDPWSAAATGFQTPQGLGSQFGRF